MTEPSENSGSPGNDELVPIGEGPVATVFACQDPQGHGAFALKAYPGPVDRRTRGELDVERRALTELRARPHVLAPDSVTALPDGRLALRMELCAQSLPELVSSFGPLTIPDALALASALASALAAAHEAGLVHGGVTPGNVLFRASGEPVLADFGVTLRRAFPGEETAGVDYLAPETVRDGTRDERTDLYGLGAVLYFALSGSSPHQGRPGEQPEELVLRTLSGEVPELAREDLPPGLAQLVSALLARNPDARPLDAAAVAARLGTMIGPVRDQPVFDDFGGMPQATAAPQPSAPSAPAGSPVPPAPAVSPVSPGSPVSPPAPLARGELLVQYGPQDKPRGNPRGGLIVGVIGAVAVLAVAAVVLLLYQPVKLGVPDAPLPTERANPAPASIAPVTIELDEPVDQGNHVELSWRSSEPLDFYVIVAEEGRGEAKTIFVRRATSHRLKIDPVLAYCFQIQGSNGIGVWESQAKPFRGGTCTES